jgi:hypothetical protein
MGSKRLGERVKNRHSLEGGQQTSRREIKHNSEEEAQHTVPRLAERLGLSHASFALGLVTV